MTGGTSDVVVAEEARTIAEEMGCEVITAYDVGIAGFHRHIKPLKRMLQEGVDAIVVVAGMEGALPSVIASLVDVPVIGVPTSVGYGFGAGGVGALTTMLQSCSPGMCVVNIDNGVGAGALAALIAHQVARALRLAQEKETG
jgi:NCAIR mutase (PurE)-related protein